MLTLPYSHKILENIIDWVVKTKCSRFGNQNYLNSPILVLYCISLIINRLKIKYLHSNGSFLVVKINIDN